MGHWGGNLASEQLVGAYVSVHVFCIRLGLLLSCYAAWSDRGSEHSHPAGGFQVMACA